MHRRDRAREENQNVNVVDVLTTGMNTEILNCPRPPWEGV
jgi:hypothetical protein